MRIAYIALLNSHSYGIRLLQSMTKREFPHIDSRSFYFYQSTYTDTDISRTDIDTFAEEVSSYKPTHICLGVHSPYAPMAELIARKIARNDARIKIIVGGPHAMANPEDCMTWADHICAGNGLAAMEEYIQNDESTIYMWPNVPPVVDDMDNMPVPYYPFFDDDEYHYGFTHEELLSAKRVSLFSSTGCIYNCSYCHEQIAKKRCGKYKIHRKSPERVVSEIQRLKHIFQQLESVSFSDHIFSFGEKWMSEFCHRKMIAHPDISFRCFGHFNHVTRSMLETMRDAGMDFISFGVQHVSKDLSGLLERHIPVHKMIEVSKVLQELGIHGRYDVIRGIPGETDEHRKEMNAFLEGLPKPHTIRNFELRYFPGTAMTKYALENSFINPDQVEGNFVRLGDWSYNYTKY